MFSGGSKGNIGKIWVKIGTLKTDDYIINKINRSLYIFCELEEMTNNFQINTVYSDLLSKVHYQRFSLSFDNGLWKVNPNIQYLFENYLSSLPIHKKCISFYLFGYY